MQTLVGRGLACQVVLRGADIGMSHTFLDIVELLPGLFEPMGEGGTQGVGGSAFGDGSGTDSSSDDPLNAAGVQVMARWVMPAARTAAVIAL